MSLLSCYVLTHNSEKHLDPVLKAISQVADDLVVVDSGSSDATEEIAKKYNSRFIFRKFDNFRDQRNFAATQCKHDYVLFIDSDEVISKEMAAAILKIKKDNFIVNNEKIEGFTLKRNWFMFDQPVNAFYPVQSPDHPMRLIDKNKVSFDTSNLVHESPSGNSNLHRITEGSLDHYSCDTVDLLFGKLNQYTTLAAHDLIRKNKKGGWIAALTHGVASLFKWYITKKGFKDGTVWVLLGFYAFAYTYLKYVKALYIERD